MNEQNLEYLKKSLDYLGFGTKLNEVMESAIRKEIPKFSLGISKRFSRPELKDPSGVAADHVHYQLNFNRAKENDTYYLNDYTITMMKYGEQARRQHTFDLERDHRMTGQQAYRLLSGNALLKEISQKSNNGDAATQKVKVWFKLDQEIQDAYGNHPLRRFYPEYNFNLSETLDKYPFQKLSAKEKERLILQLELGSMPLLSMKVDKRIVPVFVVANPQMKALEVYSEKMVPIRENEIFPDKQFVRREEKTFSGHPPMEQSSDAWKQDREMDTGGEISR